MKSTFVIETLVDSWKSDDDKDSFDPSLPPLFLLFSTPLVLHSRGFGGGVCLHTTRNVLPPPLKCPDRGEAEKDGVKRQRDRERRSDVFSDRVVLYHRKIGIEATLVNARNGRKSYRPC